MKLAIVRQKYTPYGGAERFVAQALAVLKEQGVDVEVVARKWEGDISGVRCDPFYLGRTWRDMGFARCVQRLIASGKFDLVQSHERIPGCHVFRAGDGVHATWLELADKPLTRLSPWHQYTLGTEQAMFRHPNLRAVICNSRLVRNDIASRFPAISDKLHVIYNSIDTDKFHPGLRESHRAPLRLKVSADETAPVVLFVGSGYDRKGVATLLEAIAQMDAKNAQAWIVGKDKDQAHYERMARKLGIDRRVRFFGAQADVRPFYGAADVFCLPTLYDPLPNAALEAFACGLPVITTTTCGAAEFVEPGINGGLCPPRNPAALANQLDALCLTGVSNNMREAARTTIAALDPSSMADHLIALYRECLGPAGEGQTVRRL